MSVEAIDYVQAGRGRPAAEAQGTVARSFVAASPIIETIGGLSAPVRLAREHDFRLGALTVRPSLCEVSTGANRERLQPRVMQVLVALARAEDRVVSRDALIESCWGGRIVGEDAINRCIGQLRRLAETRDDSFSIETLARVGYRLSVAEAARPSPIVAASANASGLRGAFALVVAALAIGAGALLASR